MNIKYIEVTDKEIDLIKPLWEELKSHHGEVSTHFPEIYEKFKFSERKAEILKNDTLKIV
ncbi:MAG: hypothetical protein ACXVHY_02465 [Methanobacterium sp.]